jgi:predicted lipoprotein with Yx(FWY)xxD motif
LERLRSTIKVIYVRIVGESGRVGESGISCTGCGVVVGNWGVISTRDIDRSSGDIRESPTAIKRTVGKEKWCVWRIRGTEVRRWYKEDSGSDNTGSASEW